jgi:hypothetical protein
MYILEGIIVIILVMKKIFILFSITTFLFLFSLINSCKKYGSDCGDINNKFYATTMMGETYDSTNRSQNITDSTIISFENLRISVNFTGKYYSEAKSDFSLISSAFACDPVPPYSEEKIMDITITSDQDFNTLHPAGTNLTDVFYVKKYTYDNIKYIIEEYLNTEPRIENLEFSLAFAPDFQKELQFTIIYKYEGRLVKVLKYDSPIFITSPN